LDLTPRITAIVVLASDSYRATAMKPTRDSRSSFCRPA